MAENNTVNGFRLREAIRHWKNRLQIAEKLWNDSLFSFEGETKPLPQSLSAQYEQADDAVARLEAAQQRYNDVVTVDVLGQRVKLSYAVKRLGGAARLEKMWRQAATDTGSPNDRFSVRYGSAIRQMTRNKDAVVAQKRIDPNEAIAMADEKARLASALRAAIAAANQTNVPYTALDLNPELVEV